MMGHYGGGFCGKIPVGYAAAQSKEKVTVFTPGTGSTVLLRLECTILSLYFVEGSKLRQWTGRTCADCRSAALT
jgi:hypothetical protein